MWRHEKYARLFVTSEIVMLFMGDLSSASAALLRASRRFCFLEGVEAAGAGVSGTIGSGDAGLGEDGCGDEGRGEDTSGTIGTAGRRRAAGRLRTW